MSDRPTWDGFQEWLWDEPKSPEELEKYKNELAAKYPEHFPASFTCDNCTTAKWCKLAFDPYNSDGDCLLEK